MSTEPGPVINALTATLRHEPLLEAEIRSGTPETAVQSLGSFGDCEFGIWEMTPGIACDTEADEIFVVLQGRGRIEFEDSDRAAIELAPGDVVRLQAGMRTVWSVTEPLRKFWIA